MNKLQAAAQIRKVLQMYASGITDEQAMEVPVIFDQWLIGRSYNVNDRIAYGVNGVGDPQLYKVIQAHTSQEDWRPDTTPSLYEPIGLTDDGYPIWAQPTGAHDAYNTGDIVDYNGILYKSIINGNTWSPDAYPEGWEVLNNGA